MQTADPADLESLLLKQVKDKTPFVRHLFGDDIDEQLTKKELKVELYKDGYAIYYMVPKREFFGNYMALIHFTPVHVDIKILLKPWRYGHTYRFLVFTSLVILALSFLTHSIMVAIWLPINLIILKIEKRNFRRDINTYLESLE